MRMIVTSILCSLLSLNLLQASSLACKIDLQKLTQQKQVLAQAPVRSLATDPVSAKFLSEHKVYVSLTTSPARIEMLHHVLSTLDTTHVEKIILAIPERFGRDNSEYVIPDEILRNPKIEILRPKEDIGPATKLIPAAEQLQASDTTALLVTLDDDIGYPKGMINEMIYSSAHFPNTVISRTGNNLGTFNLTNRKVLQVMPASVGTLSPDAEVTPVDIVEGYGAIAYPVSVIDTKQIKDWSSKCPECKLADDLVISMSLAKRGIPRLMYASDYYPGLIPFEHGLGPDALHNGAGRTETTLIPGPHETYNILNYRKVFRVLEPELTMLP